MPASLRADGIGAHSGISFGFLQLGMTQWSTARAEGIEITFDYAHTPALGRMLEGATDRGLCFLQFRENETQLQQTLAAEYASALLSPLCPRRRPARPGCDSFWPERVPLPTMQTAAAKP